MESQKLVRHDDHHHGLSPKDNPHESSLSITLPLVLLAIPSVVIGYITIEPMLFGSFFTKSIFLNPEVHPTMANLSHHFHEIYHGPFGMALHSIISLPFLFASSGVLLAYFCYQINLNLPEYDDLRFAGGSLLIPQIGHKGVLVFNLNGSDYFAWDASCPNHAPNTCSQTQLNGVLTECSCDSFQYSLATGQLLNPPEDSGQLYPLLFYRAETRGNAVVISN